MNTKLETLIADSKIKPIGYAQMQPLLTYEPMVAMYSTKGEAENGYEMVSLYSADQVGCILEEALRQADQQAQPQARELLPPEQLAAQAWCTGTTHDKIMDVDLCSAFADIIAADRAIRQDDKAKQS